VSAQKPQIRPIFECLGSHTNPLDDGGSLFQTSGPQIEKARLPNWVLVRQTTADLFVDDRSSRSRNVFIRLKNRILKCGKAGLTFDVTQVNK